MQIVLNKDVKKLGYRGDILNVKPGYFRNFLLPRGLADAATETRLQVAKTRNEKRVLAREQLVGSAKDVLSKLKGLEVTVKGKVGAKGKLYAGISETDVIKAIEKAVKVKLESDHLRMEHFKNLGEHKVVVHLGPDMEAEVKVLVEAE